MEPTETPTIQPDEPLGLSIDQPINNQPAIQMPTEYDGAEPSTEPATEVTTPAGKKLLRIDMGNGKYYTAETERELLQKVVDGKKEADRYIEELKHLKPAPAPAATSVTVTPRTPINYGDLPEKYDHQTYLNMLAEDPVKAQRYVMREIYGDIDPVQALQHSYSVANQVQQQMTAAEFHRRNPDYQASPEAADAIFGVLKDNGLDPNSVAHLEWGYREAQRLGKLAAPVVSDGGDVEYEDITFGTPAPKPTATVVPINRGAPPPQRRGASAPQTPRGGSGTQTPQEPVDPYSMPLDDLRKMIEGKQPLRR